MKSRVKLAIISFSAPFIILCVMLVVLTFDSNAGQPAEQPKVKEQSTECILRVYAGIDRVFYGTVNDEDIDISVMGGVYYDAVLSNGVIMKIDGSSVMELYDADGTLIIRTSVWEMLEDSYVR